MKFCVVLMNKLGFFNSERTAGVLGGLIFHPEDGGSVFLRNVWGPLPDYMA
jgi:hypothetical protein